MQVCAAPVSYTFVVDCDSAQSDKLIAVAMRYLFMFVNGWLSLASAGPCHRSAQVPMYRFVLQRCCLFAFAF